MLANLMENALRHTPAGTPISLSLENDSTGAMAILEDRGPGIPPDQRIRVFERFYRMDWSRNTAGSGLGLALVSAVAALHGISIELDDNRPGLKVILRFP
jgi:signal transduction histidine kinase